MLETFHQLREPPFGVNPDPRFLYMSSTHREAFSSLLYRIEMDAGFMAMVAQPGMGKTTLLFHLLRQLQSKARTAFIFQTQCTSSELLRHLLSEFDCPTDSTDPVRILQELKALLVAEASAGRRCIVIVDEAQNLKDEVLETIRLLSNFETPRRKLLNIVLSGQSELGEMLARAELRQLRQRLSCIAHLERFSREETTLYIAHRLGVAGYPGCVTDLFSPGALASVAELSEGVPRVINNLCFNALSLSYATRTRWIGLDVIAEVAGDLGLSVDGCATLAEYTLVAKDAEPSVEICAEPMEEFDRVAMASAGSADAFSESDVKEWPRETSEPEEDTYPQVPADHGSEVQASSMAENAGHAKRRSGEASLARGLACVLVLLLTPAIDAPVSLSVSAQSKAPQMATSTSAAISSKPDRRRTKRRTKQARAPAVHHLRHATAGPERTPQLSSLQYRASAPVDLGLASFAPEPLLDPLPLSPMSISGVKPTDASTSGTPAPIRARSSLLRVRRTADAGTYVAPKPVWQPAPSSPVWYRHPREDIELLLSISRSGEVRDVGILRGDGILASAAKRAARMWKYKPALANGKPVNSKAIVTIEFLQH